VEEMVGGVSYFAEKGIVSILSEESKCRLVVTVKPRAPSAMEKGPVIPAAVLTGIM